MKRKLLDLTGKLPPNLVEMLEIVSRFSLKFGVSHFIIGATARDLILHYGHRIAIRRATKDVDIGVAVRDWNEYERLREAFLESKNFRETRIEQRLIWNREDSIILDLVPFGQIESPKGKVAFPPDGAFVMTTHGFTEAEKDAVEVQLTDSLTIKVVSLAGLGLLKFISWMDRPNERERDVQDIWLVMKNYLDAGNEERIFDPESEHFDLIEDFDVELTGAKLFGRDMRKLLDENTGQLLQKALSEDNLNDRIYRLTAIINRSSRNFEPDDEREITVWRAFREELLG